jgi:hypothetical protein
MRLLARLMCAGIAGIMLLAAQHAGAQSADREQALLEAATRGGLAEVKQLLAGGLGGRNGRPQATAALIAAVQRNYTEVAQALIEAGADVNAKDDTGRSAFLIGAAGGNADIVTLALRHGAQLDSRDADGSTALIRAARNGYSAVVIELLRAGADLNQANRSGRTALLEAVAAGDGGPRQTAVVRILIRAGADQTLRDSSRMTALQYAQQREFREMAAVMISVGGR